MTTDCLGCRHCLQDLCLVGRLGSVFEMRDQLFNSSAPWVRMLGFEFIDAHTLPLVQFILIGHIFVQLADQSK